MPMWLVVVGSLISIAGLACLVALIGLVFVKGKCFFGWHEWTTYEAPPVRVCNNCEKVEKVLLP